MGRHGGIGCTAAIIVLVAGLSGAAAEIVSPEETTGGDPVSTDCAGVRSSSLEYKECLMSLEAILTQQVETALDEAFEERAAMDEAERKCGLGNADRVQWLDHAQRLWESFVEAECDSAFAYVAPGSDASAAMKRCHIRLLRERLGVLENGY